MMRSSPDNESDIETVTVDEREREEGRIRGSFSLLCPPRISAGRQAGSRVSLNLFWRHQVKVRLLLLGCQNSRLVKLSAHSS